MLKKAYLYQLPNVYLYKIPPEMFGAVRTKIPNKGISFESNGKQWGFISKGGNLLISRGYAWDGCTPKLSISGRVVGVSDGPISEISGLPATYHASLIHDLLCQFQGDKKMPFGRDEIDRLFYLVMVRDGFKYAGAYYWAVRALGGVYGRFISGAVK